MMRWEPPPGRGGFRPGPAGAGAAPRTAARDSEGPRPPWRRPARRAALGYAAFLHVLVVLLVAAPDLPSRLGKRWGLVPQDEMEDRFFELTLPVVEQARRDRTVGDAALVVLGDSISKQIDPARLGGNAVNYGIGGDTVRMLMWRLPVLPSVERARAVVVNAGVNDLKYRPVADIAADYRALLARLPASAALVVVSPLPVDEKAPWPRRSPHLRPMPGWRVERTTHNGPTRRHIAAHGSASGGRCPDRGRASRPVHNRHRMRKRSTEAAGWSDRGGARE